jgi:hypothetical protein
LQSADGKRNNKNPRNQRRPQKPKANTPSEPEFQHPILEKIVISKTSVQERLMRSKMIDEKDNEPKVDATPEIAGVVQEQAQLTEEPVEK